MCLLMASGSGFGLEKLGTRYLYQAGIPSGAKAPDFF
jgi:hypothetical protein